MAAISLPLYLAEAPEDTPLPYATILKVSEVVDMQTTSYPLMRTSLQISIHHSTAAGALALALQVRSSFKDAPLAILGGSGDGRVCHVLPDGDSIAEGEGLGPDGSDCWIAIEMFDVLWTP